MISSMNVHIGRATADDAPAITELLLRSELPIVGLLQHLEMAIVARADGRLVGCAALELYDDGALLRSVAVDASARGQRIGRRLTQTALDLAFSLGTPAVYLLTTTAEEFFPRFGFSRIARGDVPPGVRGSEEFQSACPTSAVVMRKELTMRSRRDA
jgi:amino-acid N-acetyltransferase